MLEPANTHTAEENQEILEAWISEHPSVKDPDRLGGRRAIRSRLGLKPRNYSTREYDQKGYVKGSRSRSLLD